MRTAQPCRKKEGLAPLISAQIAAEVERLAGAGPEAGLDFEAVETAARRTALQLMGPTLARALNADHGDDHSPRLPCECGHTARCAGRRAKTFLTVLGPLPLERAWYHCEHCHRGFSPRERALGLDGTALSPAARRMTGLSAARVSFAETRELLRELAGLDIDPKQVERRVEAGCRTIAGTRLKRSGTHWTVEGANAILALRCAILSNRFDDFWERRALAA